MSDGTFGIAAQTIGDRGEFVEPACRDEHQAMRDFAAPADPRRTLAQVRFGKDQPCANRERRFGQNHRTGLRKVLHRGRARFRAQPNRCRYRDLEAQVAAREPAMLAQHSIEIDRSVDEAESGVELLFPHRVDRKQAVIAEFERDPPLGGQRMEQSRLETGARNIAQDAQQFGPARNQLRGSQGQGDPGRYGNRWSPAPALQLHATFGLSSVSMRGPTPGQVGSADWRLSRYD